MVQRRLRFAFNFLRVCRYAALGEAAVRLQLSEGQNHPEVRDVNKIITLLNLKTGPLPQPSDMIKSTRGEPAFLLRWPNFVSWCLRLQTDQPRIDIYAMKI